MPRPELRRLVETLDAEGIESARSAVRPDDVPKLTAWYWTLEKWPQRLALIDLIQDQYHASMDDVLRHVLRAPGDGQDYVDLPKIVALGILSEEHDNFALYYSDRAALLAAIAEFLGEPHTPASTDQPATSTRPLPDDPDEALWLAATSNREAEIPRLVAASSPDLVRGGDPVLVRTIMNKHAEAALALLEAGADPNKPRDVGGQSALFWAAMLGLESVVIALLKRGAVVDAADQYNSTPLIQAASSGHPEITRMLLEAGANPLQCISDGRSALGMSVRGGKAKTLGMLLDAGASLNTKQPTFTPLAFACFEGTTAMVRLLIKRGADPNVPVTYMNYKATTPLMFAAQSGKLEMVQALLDGGAKACSRDEDGRNASEYARGKRADAIRQALAAVET